MADRTAEIEARRAATTQGAWRTAVYKARLTIEAASDVATDVVAELIPPNHAANAAFIAGAPNDIAFLLERLQKTNAILEHVISGGFVRWDDATGDYEATE